MSAQSIAKLREQEVGPAVALDGRGVEATVRPEPEHYLIGDLARDFGVTLRALRFYEDKGLLRPARRGAVRLYSMRDRQRLATILKGKQLGFTLSEIAGMIERNEDDLTGAGGGLTLRLSVEQISEQIEHLQAQKRDIEAAIDELEASRAEAAARRLD